MKSVPSTNAFAKNMFSDAFSHSEGNNYCFSKNYYTSDHNCSIKQSFLKTNLSTGLLLCQEINKLLKIKMQICQGD